jgi:hypothetical protein
MTCLNFGIGGLHQLGHDLRLRKMELQSGITAQVNMYILQLHSGKGKTSITQPFAGVDVTNLNWQ